MLNYYLPYSPLITTEDCPCSCHIDGKTKIIYLNGHSQSKCLLTANNKDKELCKRCIDIVNNKLKSIFR